MIDIPNPGTQPRHEDAGAGGRHRGSVQHQPQHVHHQPQVPAGGSGLTPAADPPTSQTLMLELDSCGLQSVLWRSIFQGYIWLSLVNTGDTI